MSIVYLAYKNLVSKPLNLALSLLLLMLSVSLVTFVFQLRDQLDNQLDRNIAPFDMVVGAKGSPLQLILSSVLHIDAPTGNIKLSDVKLLQKHPFVKAAIPVSYGDNYNGYRILGTKKEYLQRYNVGLSEGKLFEKPFEAVIGYKAARLLGLSIGDTFVGNHGLVASQGHSHDDKPYIVTGILEQSGTVVDQLIVTSLESVWDAHDHGDEHDHDEDHHHEHANEDKEITSLLVKFKSPLGMVQLPRYINENTNAQAALPGFEIQKLMNLLGSGVKTINGIAIAILLVSAFSIFISLLKTIRERRKELALLRTYGLGTPKILLSVLLEGVFISIIGFILGWILGRIGIWFVSEYMQGTNGYYLELLSPDKFELMFFGIIFVITLVATLLASVSIFKLNVAKTLSDA